MTGETFYGARLRDARLVRDLSEIDLARRCHLTAAAIRRYEAGTRPDATTIDRLAEVLGFLPTFFFVAPLPDDDGPRFFCQHREPCIKCGDISTKLCDAVVREVMVGVATTQGTCDAPLCDHCALPWLPAAPDKDVCPHHAQSIREAVEAAKEREAREKRRAGREKKAKRKHLRVVKPLRRAR